VSGGSSVRVFPNFDMTIQQESSGGNTLLELLGCHRWLVFRASDHRRTHDQASRSHAYSQLCFRGLIHASDHFVADFSRRIANFGGDCFIRDTHGAPLDAQFQRQHVHCCFEIYFHYVNPFISKRRQVSNLSLDGSELIEQKVGLQQRLPVNPNLIAGKLAIIQWLVQTN